MAITVTTQDNPLRSVVAQESSDATVIYSGSTAGFVRYEVERRDGQASWTVSSSTDVTNYPNVVSVSTSELQIILPFRQRYRVRVNEGSWVNFKTRDKRYRNPDAITQLSDDTEDYPTTKGSVTITVTNSANSSESRTARGSTVENSNTGYRSTSSITYTSRGATIVNTD